ncbi:hypothetical protein VTN77DRAFT_4415 [Rasamsonia byssochlamydoides]|uniref:uncharacterized protein n=1 Tax=Rasamsonia byssochlamydoides TaxID=89139 RepID=UPI003743941C
MYSTSHSVSAPMNGMGGDLADGSGTINPAALNTTAPLSTPPVSAPNTSPRGVKRSRSPDQYGDLTVEGEHEDDEQGRRKRGRPPKTPRPSGNGTSTTSFATPQQASTVTAPAQTPQMSSQTLPQQSDVSPPQTSPPAKTTPTKTMVKALPTVRDHTTDQLNADGDEYIPKEFDEAGEKKVDALGYPQDGREYKCRTFRVPNRGNKLFMLATECARVLGYRDSYLLFNKNRSLYKIIATQAEKDDLIQQDILPYSYRSRQIAIVTAKSMFRQFGSRVIVNGRRVRDDYWESKARKQGFTEDDLAGEKRPGAAKARDAAAAEAAANAGLLPTLGHGDVVYSNAIEGLPHGLPPGLAGPHAVSLAPLPMIHLTPTTDDPRLREYSSIPRPRQELAGQPYQDRTQPSSATEIMNQASHTADFNKILNSQRAFRHKGLEEFYAAQRDIPVSTTSQPQVGQIDATPVVSQALQSPQMPSSSGLINPSQQPQQQNLLAQPTTMLTPSQGGYSQQPHQQTHVAQSPVRGVPQGIRPDVLHQRSSNPALSSATSAQTPAFGYPSQTQQMWGQPPPQPQPSPMTASPHMGMPQYASPMHPQQQSPSPLPHQAQQQQPHPSQSPHNQPRLAQPMPQSLQMHPQVPQPQGMPSLGYQGGAAAAAYSNIGNPRAMYTSAQNPSQQFLAGAHQQPTGMGLGMGAMPGWPSSAGGHMQPGQPQQGQSGSPLGGWSGY